jgi:hypothetical protein
MRGVELWRVVRSSSTKAFAAAVWKLPGTDRLWCSSSLDKEGRISEYST